MSNFLETLETKLRDLLEGTLDRLLSPGTSRSFSSRLVAMIDAKLTEEVGERLAPDLIDIYVSPERWEAWQEARPTLDEVAGEIQADWTAEGYHFRRQVMIRLIPSSDLDVEDIDIRTSFSDLIPKKDTSPTILQPVTRPAANDPLPRNAYFIINGHEQTNLCEAVISVGRRTTSDVVIKDPLVSRDHLQLRAQGGRYILFDLSSTGGTYINNMQVTQAMLKPGDVIRIGKTILIYNQDYVQPSTPTSLIPLNGEDR